MSRARALLLVALVTGLAFAGTPARAEYVDLGAGGYRFLSGSMSKSGVNVSFDGGIHSGAYAYEYYGEPDAAPYVDSIYGFAHVWKGTQHRVAFGRFNVTVDPALATAKITGTVMGITLNITVTPTGNPAPLVFTPGPNDVDPPYFAYIGAGVQIYRLGTATGSMSSSIGSISGGSGAGRVGTGAGGGVFFENYDAPR